MSFIADFIMSYALTLDGYFGKLIHANVNVNAFFGEKNRGIFHVVKPGGKNNLFLKNQIIF
jgi:hypothetical protein